MKISRSDLESTYKRCGDEELIQRLQSGTLTEMAEEVARAEALSRGLSLPQEHSGDEADSVKLADASEASLVTIKRFTYPTEAQMVSSFLQSKGIYTAIIGAHYMQATTPWGVNALGGVRLMVPAAQVTDASALLEEFKDGTFALPDDTDPPQA